MRSLSPSFLIVPYNYLPTILHKRKAVHVAHVRDYRVPFLDSQYVETTDELLEYQHNTTSNFFFSVGQNHGKSHLLPVRISLHFPINRRRLSGFGMSVFGANGIHFDIRALCFDKLFVNITPISPHFVNIRVKLGRPVADFSKKLFATPSCTRGIVNTNLVILENMKVLRVSDSSKT